jgi:signal transduction histidine kinase
MASPFPLVSVLGTILAWQHDPTDERRRRIGDALGRLVSLDRPDARGVYLAAAPDAIAGLSVGWGTLDGGVPAPSADCVEIRDDDDRHLLGSLWLDPPGRPSAEAIRAIQLAVQAAWSRNEQRRSNERLEALDAATRGISGLHSLDRVLQLIADRVRELIGAEYAALGIVDEFGVIERFVTSGISREQREAIGALPRGHGLLGLIVRENRSYRIPDIGAHGRSFGFPPHHPAMTSFLGVPIQVKGRSVGNFYLTNKRVAAEFSESDQRLAEMFALHAGIAIENARLHEQVQRMAIVDERARIGKDLHDGIIQSLYGVSLSLEDVPDLMREDPPDAVARVDRAIDTLNVTIRDIRNFIFGLRPEIDEAADLVAGIATQLEEFHVNSVIDVELDADPGLPDVGEHRRGEILKMVREALSNAARHSKATRVRVRVGLRDDQLDVEIVDNGTGFAPGEARDGSHLGLANMRARAIDLGGELVVESAEGAGTTIAIRVPAFAPNEIELAPRGGES